MRRTLAVMVFVFSLTLACFGQVTATISGRVMDQQQSVIPNATVTVESPELGITRIATTGAEGLFTVTNLPVGTYTLRVSAPGFSTYKQVNIKLDVGGTLDRQIVLAVGAAEETVNVTETVYQTVNTETANVESLISGTQVREIALNGRNWAQLINLAPGTAAMTQDTQQGTNVRIDDSAINGTRRRFQPTIDGVSNVDHGSVATQVNNISIDAIEEFKLVSTPYSAEYGGQAGPAINVVTKRGTTGFHGSLFEFFRHDALNAYSWESKRRTNPEKAHLRFNNFGGFLGGPLYKDKLFFFGGVEWKLPRTGRSLNERVPSLAMRQGDFSAFLPTNSGPITSCDQTLVQADRDAGRFILCDKSSSTTGVPFVGNIMPMDKMSPNGLAIINLFPSPNAGVDSYIDSPVTSRNVRQDLFRLDWVASQNATIFGRYLSDSFDSDNPLGSTFDNQQMPIAPDNHKRSGDTLMINYTQMITPTLLNDLSFAWQRNDQTIGYQDVDLIDRTKRGITFTEIFAENRLNKIPEVTIQGYSTITGNGLPYDIKAHSYELRENLSKMAGAHQLKGGFMFIRAFKQENTRVRDGGTINFSTAASDSTLRPQDAGHAMANLLLGAYQRYQEYSNTTNVPSHYNQWEFYFNDQWRVNRRLSLTLGLRYQYMPWPIAEDGRIVGFDPTRFDPDKAPASANITSSGINLIADPTGTHTRAEGYYDPYNGIVLPGCENKWGNPDFDRLLDCRPNGLAKDWKKGWAPRFGFSFDPFGDAKMTIRGGAGVYYDRTLLNPVRDAGANVPFTSQPNITNGRQYTTPANLTGLTNYSNPLDTVGEGGTGRPLVQTLNVFGSEMRPGAIYAYSFGVQRELPWQSMLEVSYVGNQGRFLTHRRDINYVIADAALARNTNGTYVNPRTDSVRQYLGYQAIQQQENNGVSTYNSLQTNFVKRMSKGFTTTVAYTWSKTLNTFDNETANLRVPFDDRYDRSYADFDRRHVIAISYVYEFPWLKSQQGFTGKVFGGWQLSGTTTWQSGRHFGLSGGSRAGTSPSIGYGGNMDMVGDWRFVPKNAGPDQWVNPCGSPLPASEASICSGVAPAFAGRVGFIATAPRNVIEMPSQQFWNMSLTKRTRISESVKLQFRAEAFNVWNVVNFRNIQTNFSSSNFGKLTETEDPRVLQFGAKLTF